jgi:hypothetical protein
MPQVLCTRATLRNSAKLDRAQLWRFLQRALTIVAVSFALMFVASRSADAAVAFVGSGAYTYAGSTAVLSADEVANFDPVGNLSGTLKLELWAAPAPYTGAYQSGYKLAEYRLGQLGGSFYFSNINSGNISFTPPPNGTWYLTMLLTEYVGGPADGGYTPRDYINFAPVAFGPPPPPPPPPPSVTPEVGLWWNPNESGSGYALDYKHGVLVVTIYSYTATGGAQWYLASGPLVGNTFTSTLDKYVGGECIHCSYNGRPTMTGNDGAITIIFTSSTSASVSLPGGRVTQIQPQAF